MSDDLTRKAIVTFNGSYADGLTKALQAVVAMALEEAAKMIEDRHRFRIGSRNEPSESAKEDAAAIRALKDKV